MNLPNANTCCSQQQIFYRTLYECNNTVGSFFFSLFSLAFIFLVFWCKKQKKMFYFIPSFWLFSFDYSIFVVIAVQFLTIESINKHTKNDWWIFEVDTFFFPLLIHTPIISQLQQKQQQKIRTNPYTRRQIIIDFFVLFYSSFCAKSTRSVSNTNRQKKMCFK